ncbi:MAG TPA: ATP-dependent RecD-like DNA helicase [Bacilli bacterium]|nr:ATP-dependent RecD-like DNA helicase [Bacilli bacterium]
MNNYIRGTLKKIIFRSVNGFSVINININEITYDDYKDYKEIIIVGNFHDVLENEEYTFFGNFVESTKYGIQYKVEKYEKILPSSEEGLILFLSSGIFNKVGEKTAKSIVNILGTNCLDIIINDYEKLLLVPKMTISKAMNIKESLLKYNESYNTVIYLVNKGFSMNDALKIYEVYKEETTKVINENVYQIIDDVMNISFKKVDCLKESFNIDIYDEKRLLALLIYIQKELTFRSGDTYLYKEEVYKYFIIELNSEISYEYFEELLLKLNNKIILDNDRCILFDYYYAENNVADYIYSLINKKDNKVSNINQKILKLEYDNNIIYNDRQKEAIKNSVIKNFSIITGGPGTGKTKIIDAIISLNKDKYNISELVLLAPTGRASKKMTEACAYPASTIHRYLKWDKDTNIFGFDKHNKVDAKFIIIDEVSMIDAVLFSKLIDALKKDVKIVLIGDIDQLESVSPGSVLKDLIESELFQVTYLKEIYRQKEDSFILDLAYYIRNSDVDIDLKSKKEDYMFIESNSIILKEYLKKVIIKNKDINIKDMQVIIPQYRGNNGIDEVNKLMQSLLNNSNNNRNEIKNGSIIFREKDKILQLENMPDSNVFNGDIGIISKINGSEITVDFDSNIVKYKPSDYKAITHGYAISAHKAQGSEFKVVILPILYDYRGMLYKKIIYTSVTRAKDMLYIIGDINAFNYGIHNNNYYVRKTRLKEVLLNIFM